MSAATVQIDELRVRASGLTREQARHLGEAVAKRLVELPLGTEQSRNIPTVTLRVRSNAAGSIERTADEIAVGIRRSLG